MTRQYKYHLKNVELVKRMYSVNGKQPSKAEQTIINTLQRKAEQYRVTA